MEHTKGKWVVEDFWIKSGNYDIAAVCKTTGIISDKEAKANARLIAAAPLLLAACKKAYVKLDTLFDGSSGTGRDSGLMILLEQAIATAQMP